MNSGVNDYMIHAAMYAFLTKAKFWKAHGNRTDSEEQLQWAKQCNYTLPDTLKWDGEFDYDKLAVDVIWPANP